MFRYLPWQCQLLGYSRSCLLMIEIQKCFIYDLINSFFFVIWPNHGMLRLKKKIVICRCIEFCSSFDTPFQYINPFFQALIFDFWESFRLSISHNLVVIFILRIIICEFYSAVALSNYFRKLFSCSNDSMNSVWILIMDREFKASNCINFQFIFLYNLCRKSDMD